MDPDACLKEMLDTADEIASAGDGMAEALGGDLADLVLALDGWLSKGGFLPERWARPGREGEGG